MIPAVAYRDSHSIILTKPGFVIWGFDRLFRLLRLVILNKMWLFPSRRVSQGLTDINVEVLGSDVLRVIIQRDGLSWRAGQHA
jgi:ferric-chelate reductase